MSWIPGPAEPPRAVCRSTTPRDSVSLFRQDSTAAGTRPQSRGLRRGLRFDVSLEEGRTSIRRLLASTYVSTFHGELIATSLPSPCGRRRGNQCVECGSAGYVRSGTVATVMLRMGSRPNQSQRCAAILPSQYGYESPSNGDSPH